MKVASGNPFTFKSGEVGYIHRNGALVAPPRREKPQVVINCGRLMEGFLKHRRLKPLADILGVSCTSLLDLGVGWSDEKQAWAFGEKDGEGNLVGIELRNNRGDKWMIPGSHRGLTIPASQPGKTVYITEGASDTAAGLTLGLWAVGRPNCQGGMRDLPVFIRRVRATRAVIISDNDDPGLRGAQKLSENLPVPSCVIVPPAKDLRQFHRDGGTRETIEALARSSVWHNRR